VIAGDGPALPQLRRQVESLKVSDRVTFLGVVPRARIPDVVAAFGCCPRRSLFSTHL